jgi:Transmembrane protein 65/GAF domain
MDNIVMIQAGEAIDMSLGVAFGLSTLTAAGFGQCVSDVAGFTCGGLVDAAVSKMNLPHHNLSPAQLDLKVTRTWHTVGGCVGVVTGCLLGMTCLLFMDTDRADRAKKAKELQSIFESVIENGKTLINAGKLLVKQHRKLSQIIYRYCCCVIEKLAFSSAAVLVPVPFARFHLPWPKERATLWMLEEDSKTNQKTIIWSRVASGVNGVIMAPLDGSIVGECIRTGEIINIEDAYQDDRFDPKVDQSTGFHTKSVLAVPVKDEKGKIIGAIQMINRKDDAKEGKLTSFGEGDVRCAQIMCSHVSCFIRVVHAG